MFKNRSKTCLEIYYQYVRRLRIRLAEQWDNECSTNFKIICLTENTLKTRVWITNYLNIFSLSSILTV